MATIEELLVPAEKRRENLSPLMRAQAVARRQGVNIVNACPFGCDIKHLDQNGYCRHLIGFTNDKKTFERMVKTRHGRVVRVPKIRTGEADLDGNAEYTPCPEPILKGDKTIQITTSWRVYRDVDKTPLEDIETVQQRLEEAKA